jgi:hypothetical protein
MNIIHATEKALTFHGDAESALYLVESLRSAYEQSGMEMTKSLSDFVFNIECALQDAGVLNEWFEKVAA